MRVDIDAAAGELWEAAQSGDHAPERWNGALKLDDALAIQLTILGIKERMGAELAGWKVGLTSPRSRRALGRGMPGANARPFGHLLKAGTHPDGGSAPVAAAVGPHIEPELCFVFARPVDDPSQLETAVGSVHAAFELNEDRPGSAAEPDLPLVVADNLAQWGLVVGAGGDPRRLDLGQIRVSLACDGEVVDEAVSSQVLDDHWQSLAALVEGLGRHSRRIEAGHRVITGAFARFPVAAGQRWEATFDGIGTVTIGFE